jgi:glycosyltransferase involved in cell wall biosynthesis
LSTIAPAQNPAISVVMPLRDGERWVAAAVDSVRRQTCDDWELIVVDDGSRDSGPQLVRQIAVDDPRVRVVNLPAGERGLVAALNEGLKHASGPLLARMDADDLAHPERFALQKHELDSDASLFAVSCRAEAFPRAQCRDGMRRYLGWQNALASPEAIARERFVESPVLHPTLMLRTSVLRSALDGWRDRGWAEDYDLVLRACEADLRIGRVLRVLLAWRNHEDQYTRQDPRCSADAFAAARAHFLARHLRARLPEGREVVMLGAGPTGKVLARGLAAEGFQISAFYDVDPKKIGNRIEDWPVRDSRLLADLEPRPFGLAAVGSPGGRDRLRQACLGWKWLEEDDFLVVA